jgi:hypothetical protein
MVGGPHVPDFQFYVTDDRYSVRSLLLVTASSRCGARRIAQRVLGQPHHHAVEVWEREQQLFTLSEADPRNS